MQDIITLSELKDNPNGAIDDVQERRSIKVVTKRGKPAAVIINLEDYIQMKQALAQAEAREIALRHQNFLEADKRGEVGSSDELWKQFGLIQPGKVQEAAS
jgi:prevent-host-death family protein